MGNSTPAAIEVVARYSRLKCFAWSVGVIATFAYADWEPFSSGQFVLNARYGWLWPFVAVASPLAFLYAFALLFRAFAFGGRMAFRRDADLIVDYPIGRKTFRLGDISSAWPSEKRVDSADYVGTSNLFKIPTVSYVPQVTIAFHGGKTINIPTPLLTTNAGQIAAALDALIAGDWRPEPLSR